VGTPQEGKGAQEDLCAPFLLMERQAPARRADGGGSGSADHSLSAKAAER